MKKELKNNLTDVLHLLAARDPEWKGVKMLPKFKCLYLGWRQMELKNKVHSHIFYTYSWQRGWLPIEDWRRFRDYAMQ